MICPGCRCLDRACHGLDLRLAIGCLLEPFLQPIWQQESNKYLLEVILPRLGGCMAVGAEARYQVGLAGG